MICCSLRKKYLRDFVDMLAQGEGYVRAEEAFKVRDNEAVGERRIGEPGRPIEEGKPSEARSRFRTSSERKRARTPPWARRQGSPNRRMRRGSPLRKFHNYAPLNASKIQVLMKIREQLPKPERMRIHPGKRNPNKFCLYHRDHGHDTEECIQLQDKVEELIRRGRLGRFLRCRPKGREDRSRALP
ncbi:hypothetical protein COCNU_scaffold028527G000010 [Cocos nucifera]|nr:hypothetical protein [Cocos nucifera]